MFVSAEFCSRNNFKISRGRRRQGEEFAGPLGLQSGLFSSPRFFPNWRTVFFQKKCAVLSSCVLKKIIPTHPPYQNQSVRIVLKMRTFYFAVTPAVEKTFSLSLYRERFKILGKVQTNTRLFYMGYCWYKG